MKARVMYIAAAAFAAAALALPLWGFSMSAPQYPDETLHLQVQRNGIVGDPIHRVDLRLQKHLALNGRAGFDGIVEVFNIFNHANYGSYTTVESNRLYGLPSSNTNVAYQPRMAQLGFRITY